MEGDGKFCRRKGVWEFSFWAIGVSLRWTAPLSPYSEYSTRSVAFGRLGEIDDVSTKDQQQKLGPGVFGFLEIKDDVAVKYEISWLFGLSQLTPDHSIKWLVEFEYKY